MIRMTAIVTPGDDGIGLAACIQARELERLVAVAGHPGIAHVEEVPAAPHLVGDPGAVFLPDGSHLGVGLVYELAGEFAVGGPGQRHLVTPFGVLAQAADTAEFIVWMGEDGKDSHDGASVPRSE